MKATIVSHSPVSAEESEEIYRFGFILDAQSGASPYAESISLCTARALAARLENGNAFVEMLNAIVATDPADYGVLIGRTFEDRLVPPSVAPSARCG